MRINPINGKNPYEIYANKENIQNKNTAAPVSSDSNRDRVELSSEGARFKEAAPVMAKVKAAVEEDTDDSRIQLIKEKIESGSYHVSSTDLARAILNGLV